MNEIDALVKEGIMDAGDWKESANLDETRRQYSLTTEGERLAALSENEVLAYLAKKGIHEIEHVQITWGLA